MKMNTFSRKAISTKISPTNIVFELIHEFKNFSSQTDEVSRANLNAYRIMLIRTMNIFYVRIIMECLGDKYIPVARVSFRLEKASEIESKFHWEIQIPRKYIKQIV